MDSQTRIMVNIADRTWTMEALHCACIMARKTSAKIVLMKMIPVQHPGLLGTNLGYINFSYQEQQDVEDYEATIKDYSVEFSSHLFQYMTLGDAISKAAQEVKAQIVFATLPASLIPFWHDFQTQGLRRRLARHQRQLIENPSYDSQPQLLTYEAMSVQI